MKAIKYELKYCERCGTLKLRPISSANNCCLPCERLLARYRLPRGATNEVAPGKAGEMKVLAGILLPVSGTAAASGRVQ